MEKKIIGIIPARYKSTRFPGKPLCSLLGKPMIIWVAELSSKALGKENVFVATDDERISRTVSNFGAKFIITSSECLTGTDRVAEVAKKIKQSVTGNGNASKEQVAQMLMTLLKFIFSITK